MKYFNNCKTLEELRKEYKRLVKQNHPDNGGSEDAIKVINVEYETALNNLKNADENENAWKYDKEKDELFRNALNKIINLEDVKIEIIGCWIWVTGNTYKEGSKKIPFLFLQTNENKFKKVLDKQSIIM